MILAKKENCKNVLHLYWIVLLIKINIWRKKVFMKILKEKRILTLYLKRYF